MERQSLPPTGRQTSSFTCGCLLALAAVVFLFGAAIALWRKPALANPLFGPELPRWTRSEPVTLLVLGTDKRPDEQGPARSDTIMLAMFDPQAKHVALLSIPRDLWVTIPGHGENRINTAFFYGQAYQVPSAGPTLAALTVEYNFGVPVDYWATIDFQGFESIVDALGGIDIEVPQEIYDPAYPDDRGGTVAVHFPAGLQHMDGKRALQYARTRHADSDFGRARRQQQVVRSIMEKVLSPKVVPQLPRLATRLSQAVQTNADPQMALALAGLAPTLEGITLDARVVDENLAANYVTATGAYVLLPDWASIHALVAEMFAARLPQTAPLAGVTLEVQNGTGLPGLAQQTAAFLQGQGATIVAAADLAGEPLERSQLLVHAERPEALQYLLSLYGLHREMVSAAAPSPSGAELTLLLGWDVIVGSG